MLIYFNLKLDRPRKNAKHNVLENLLIYIFPNSLHGYYNRMIFPINQICINKNGDNQCGHLRANRKCLFSD